MIRQRHAQSELKCILAGRCVEEISAQFSELRGEKLANIQKLNWELQSIEFSQAPNFLLQHHYSRPNSCVHSELLPSSFCLYVCLSVRPSVWLPMMWTTWVQSVPGFPGSSLALGCLSNTGSLCWAAAHWTSQGPHIHKGMFGWIRYTATHTASLPVWLHKRNLTSKLGQGGSCCTLSPDGGRGFVQRTGSLFWSCGGHWNYWGQ